VKTLTLDRITGLKVHDGGPTADERAAGLVEAIEAIRDGRMSLMPCEPQTGGVEALERAGFVFAAPAESTSFTEPVPEAPVAEEHPES